MREDVEVDALRWQEAIEADSIDWTSFTAWLEASPDNRHAFDAIAQVNDMIDGYALCPGAKIWGLSARGGCYRVHW